MSNEQATAEVQAFLASAKRWWGDQRQIPRRVRLIVATAVFAVIPFAVGAVPGTMTDSITWWALIALFWVCVAWRRHFNELRTGERRLGTLWKIGAWVVAVILAAIGGFVALQWFGNTLSTTSDSSSGPSGIVSGLAGMFSLMGVAFNLILWAGIIFGAVYLVRRFKGRAPQAGSAQVAQYANPSSPAAAPRQTMAAPSAAQSNNPAITALLHTLTTPAIINRHLYNTGMIVQLGREGSNRIKFEAGSRAETAASAFYLAKTIHRMASKDDPDLYTLNGMRNRVPHLARVETTDVGVIAWYNMLPATTLDFYEKGAVMLAAELGLAYKIKVRQTRDDARARLVQFVFKIADPLASVMKYDFSLSNSVASVVFAIDDDGKVLRMALLESNILLGGQPGGGKSGGLAALLAGAVRLENVAIIGLDPKKVELSLWRKRFSYVATEDDEASMVLQLLNEEMDRRYQWLADNGLRKITESMLSPQMPMFVLVVDELADLVANGTSKEEKDGDNFRSNRLRRLVSLGRAAAIAVIPATQKPQSDVIPTALRDLLQQRVAYATTNAAMTDTILGQGMSGNGALAHHIAADEKGVCYVVNVESREPIRARTFWVPDEEIAQLVDSTAHLRVPLPWLEEGMEKMSADDGAALAAVEIDDDDLLYDPRNDEDFSR